VVTLAADKCAETLLSASLPGVVSAGEPVPLPPAVGLMVPEMVEACGVTTIVPPRPEPGIAMPAAVDDETAATEIGFEEPSALGEIVNVAVARTPALMTFKFVPYARQIVVPIVLEQLTPLPAAVALDPANTFTPTTTEDG